jgi:hypothetical protein
MRGKQKEMPPGVQYCLLLVHSVQRVRLTPFFQDPNVAEPPEPDNPMGESSFATHKTVLKWIWKDQLASRVCPLTWEHQSHFKTSALLLKS